MYHAVTIGTKNTYRDWYLVPDGRPVIAMPSLKTITVDIPGANGVLDLSESLTKYPLYGNREGSLKFHVLNEKNISWSDLYTEIANYLHGRRRNIKLEDDPDYYYTGRFEIDWTSNNNGSWSIVDLQYSLDPYKYFGQTSLQEESNTYQGISLSGTTKTLSLTNKASIGRMPVVPSFVVTNIGTGGITVTLTNSELGISNRSYTITQNGTHKFYDMILSNLSGSNTLTLELSGRGVIDVSFRRASL